MSAPTELVKGNGHLLILSCLNRATMHGYGIANEISRISDGYFTIGFGTLYLHLHDLEENGLIEGDWEVVTGARRRKCYKITDAGRAEYIRRSQEVEEFQRQISQFLKLVHKGGHE